jgi:hypothetical protein
MMFLQTAVRVLLFGIGLGFSGNWQKAVLNSYSVSCTMLPHPAPYPNKLILLSKGHFTIKGVKELFACDYEPMPGFEGMHRPRIILNSPK